MLSVETVIGRLLSSTSYVIHIDEGCWVVDCGDFSVLKSHIETPVRGVLLTHGHFDHINGLNRLIELYPFVKIYTNEFGRQMLLDAKRNLSYYHENPFVISKPECIRIVKNNDAIRLSDDITSKAVYTPGHNPSCVTWVVDDAIFTGDSYIPGITTVTNLPGGNKKEAQNSLNLINKISIGKRIYPGHK